MRGSGSSSFFFFLSSLSLDLELPFEFPEPSGTSVAMDDVSSGKATVGGTTVEVFPGDLERKGHFIAIRTQGGEVGRFSRGVLSILYQRRAQHLGTRVHDGTRAHTAVWVTIDRSSRDAVNKLFTF